MSTRNFVIGALALGAVIGGPPRPEQGLELRINLPAYRLEVWDGEELIRSYEATIGAPAYATPAGSYSVERIVWNPWWNPPESEWAEGKDAQPPGPGNSMGRAKLQFDRLLYVHGTSLTDQLGQARSHGCIRLSNEDVLDLARLIAERTGLLSADELARLEADPGATRSVELSAPIPIQIDYRLVEELDGEIRQLEDVYRRGLSADDQRVLDRRQPTGAPLAGN